MSDLHATVSSSLAERYEALAALVREQVEPMSDEQFWRKPLSETQRPAKQDVLRHFDEAVAVVLRAIRAQSEADWLKAYTARREEDAGNRFNIFLRCATRLDLDVGQLIYLRYQLEG
jgi:hypothetical protein